VNNIEELKQECAKKFDKLLVQKVGLEKQLEAVKEEMVKQQGGYEALCKVSEQECVSNDSQ